MKRVVTIALTLAILGVLYWKVDFREVLAALRQARLEWLLGGLVMLVPLVLINATRLVVLAPRGCNIRLGESVRIGLASAVLNMVLPSKMGDLAKAWFLRQRGHLSGPLAFALIVFERTCDSMALFLFCAAGLWLLPNPDPLYDWLALAVAAGLIAGLALLSVRSLAIGALSFAHRLAPKRLRPGIENLREAWDEMHKYFWSQSRMLVWIALLTVGIWSINLVQAWIFIRALGGHVPLMHSFGLTPLAILAGLLPVTFAGVGTRDVAVVYLYSDYLDPATGAALGLLLTLRWVLLGLAGLPSLGTVMSRIQRPAEGADSPT